LSILNSFISIFPFTCSQDGDEEEENEMSEELGESAGVVSIIFYCSVVL